MADKMRTTTKVFYALLALLMADALIEMSMIAATVAFLHTRAGRSFLVSYNGTTFPLHGKPVKMLADQGHTSNGAAGTALILVGILGFLTFPLLQRNAQTGKPSAYSRITTTAWLVLSLLSMLFTLSALIFTFVITAQHNGQNINVGIASRLNDKPYPNYVAYPLDSWTPENWFAAVLDLNLVYSGDRSLIAQKYHVMMGWRWNLIPMFLLGVAVFATGLREVQTFRRGAVMQQKYSEKSKAQDLEAEVYGNHAESPMLTPEPQVTQKSVAHQHVSDASS